MAVRSKSNIEIAINNVRDVIIQKCSVRIHFE